SFNPTATPDPSTLSLHDALPIWPPRPGWRRPRRGSARGTSRSGRSTGTDPASSAPTVRCARTAGEGEASLAPTGGSQVGPGGAEDRKSTRLNSSHLVISYAVFCL